MNKDRSSANELPDADHVVHYVGPANFEDGVVNGAVFQPRSQDIGLSVNWLECFNNRTKMEQLAEVRRLSRLTLKTRGCLAELNVGETKHHINNAKIAKISFVKKPLPATNDYEADPSHSEIMGLPPNDSTQAALLGDMIAECIKNTHPAILK